MVRLGRRQRLAGGANVAQLGVGIEVVGADADYASFALAAFEPVGNDDGHVHVARLFPRLAAALCTDKVRRVDAQRVDHLCADAVDGGLQVVAQLLRHDARGDGDAGEVRHLVGAHCQAVAGVSAGRGAQDEVEGVFAVDSQSRDLCAQLVARYVACLAAVAVQAQTTQFRRGQLYGVPFQHDRGLGGIAAAQDGRRRRVDTEGRVDVFLERFKLLNRLLFGSFVACYVDVDN